MHQKLCQRGFTVDRETIRFILQTLDPDGVERRRKHVLQRQVYITPGPRFIWHVDGYDKLKPFGFCIHGAIDGYSRKILWLEVSDSNNNPAIVASYFLSCIKELRQIPRIIRADRGSENVNIAGIQRYCSGNSNNSFIFGTSTSNQRIECWWSSLRKSRIDWWINYFKDLRDRNIFDDGITYHVECMRFCFLDLLQEELNEAKVMWNNHYIRKSRHSECPPGRPNVNFFAPTRSNGRQCAVPVRGTDITVAEAFCQSPRPHGCLEEFTELAHILMNEQGLVFFSRARNKCLVM